MFDRFGNPLWDLIGLIDAIEFALQPPRPRRINPKDAWFYTAEWRRAERDAEDDLKAGRYEDFADVDALIAVLKQNDPTARLDQADRLAMALRRFRRRR
ncbi:MAG: hypothetical protein RMN52_10250 [Anaerolineae bacterium]|nr:hypothetical protein [Candidatus Roseilinea sp.]MDW8450375.1 hypothetical protein [Anaerolineae bacterium]